MVDMTTEYMGLQLAHPLMPGASPLVDDLDMVRRLEDAGASAIVMHSLFEEQITGEEMATYRDMDFPSDSFGEALSYLPDPHDFALGPDDYLEHLAKIKAAVSVPVIASLNGTTPGGWLEHARLIEEAGADALELNVFQLAADPAVGAASIERRTQEMVCAVTGGLGIPVAVKLSPYYTSLAHFSRSLVEAGARGLVLFNRFYQPDVDPEALQATPVLRLSNPSELLLRLRWLAVLSDRVGASLAASGGVHDAEDVVKAIMCGAHAVQLVSVLLTRGAEHLGAVRESTLQWMEEHEYESVRQMRGNMSLTRCPDPGAFSRANYMKILQGWKNI